MMAEYIVRVDESRKATDHPKDPVAWLYSLPVLEEVVRCRDCIYWCDEDFCSNPQWQTGPRSSGGIVELPCTFPDDFCSYSERREVTDER